MFFFFKEEEGIGGVKGFVGLGKWNKERVQNIVLLGLFQREEGGGANGN